LANRVLALLSHILNHAIDKGERLENSNPCRKVKKFPEQRRERFLTIEELSRLGAAIVEGETVGIPWEPDPRKKVKHAPKEENRGRAHLNPHTAAALRLLLFTGARLREILHLQWDHVDFGRGVLLLPDSKTGQKTIILNAPARAVLSSLPHVGQYAIAGDFAGTKKERPKADLNRPWRSVTKRAGLKGVRLHDLRHTFASYGAGASLGLPIVGRLLGHTQPATTARYAHLAADPLRSAADTIGNRIADALGSTEMAPNNVVAIR
jgi:integrase